jgi:hypothetical protein
MVVMLSLLLHQMVCNQAEHGHGFGQWQGPEHGHGHWHEHEHWHAHGHRVGHTLVKKLKCLRISSSDIFLCKIQF